MTLLNLSNTHLFWQGREPEELARSTLDILVSRLRLDVAYDGVQVLLAAPWHAIASIPGALVLVLWSAGVALAAAAWARRGDGAAALLAAMVLPGAAIFRLPIPGISVPSFVGSTPRVVAWGEAVNASGRTVACGMGTFQRIPADR